MYSASASSSTEPPNSRLASRIAAITFITGRLYAFSRAGSSTTWYCLTMPPMVATSATSGTVFSSYLRNQSCSARSSARSWRPLLSTSAYS